jgi:hypothetical protein
VHQRVRGKDGVQRVGAARQGERAGRGRSRPIVHAHDAFHEATLAPGLWDAATVYGLELAHFDRVRTAALSLWTALTMAEPRSGGYR